MTQGLAASTPPASAGPAAGGDPVSSGGAGARGGSASGGAGGIRGGSASSWGGREVVGPRDAVADAKDEWLHACAEGASSARVQQLYEHYRALVIERYAELVTERPSRAS